VKGKSQTGKPPTDRMGKGKGAGDKHTLKKCYGEDMRSSFDSPQGNDSLLKKGITPQGERWLKLVPVSIIANRR
jgi:hypothetical protein